MHEALFAQSALDLQVELHTAAPHAKGKQFVAPGVTHLPAPSHVPSLPQVDCDEPPHWRVMSVVPAGSGEHVPGAAVVLHETQGPEQALSQHTPCAEHTRPVEH